MKELKDKLYNSKEEFNKICEEYVTTKQQDFKEQFKDRNNDTSVFSFEGGMISLSASNGNKKNKKQPVSLLEQAIEDNDEKSKTHVEQLKDRTNNNSQQESQGR